MGSTISLRVELKVGNGNCKFWENVKYALGCGPALTRNGKIIADPVAGGFTKPKIVSYSMACSALGVTSDNGLLLVTVNSATIKELAQIMQLMGATNSMNLDGGASSGLYYKGKY